MQISNFKRLEIDGTGALVPYIHMNGRIGVLVGFTFDNEATATDERFLAMGKDVAMQIAATNPVSLDKESVPADIREHEFEIYKAPSPASPRISRRRSPRAAWRSSTRRTASWSRNS